MVVLVAARVMVLVAAHEGTARGEVELLEAVGRLVAVLAARQCATVETPCGRHRAERVATLELEEGHHETHFVDRAVIILCLLQHV